MDEKEFYTVPEFASKVRVHANTVRKGIHAGRIQAFKTGIGKKSAYRIPNTEITRICELDMTRLIERIVEEKMERKNAPA